MQSLSKQRYKKAGSALYLPLTRAQKTLLPGSKEILEREGLKAEILRSAVKPELWEEWVKAKVSQGVDVIIANPKLVETGLDLLDFPTLIFHQTGYSVYTLRQASRRSWRIGQNRDVKVYYLFYRNTIQEKALQLMGSKMEASLAIEGKFSEEGLLAMTQGEDMSTALAKALVDGLDVEGAEDIWRKINEKNAEMTGKEVTEDLQSEPGEEKESDEAKKSTPKPKPIKIDPNKVVYVDFMTFVGNKRKKRKVKKMALTQAEFDEMVDNTEKQIQAQFSLF